MVEIADNRHRLLLRGAHAPSSRRCPGRPAARGVSSDILGSADGRPGVARNMNVQHDSSTEAPGGHYLSPGPYGRDLPADHVHDQSLGTSFCEFGGISILDSLWKI